MNTRVFFTMAVMSLTMAGSKAGIKEEAVEYKAGDVVCELPMYTRNYVQEGGGIQLGKSDRKKPQEVA